jgi:hypothetical protein
MRHHQTDLFSVHCALAGKPGSQRGANVLDLIQPLVLLGIAGCIVALAIYSLS